MNAHTKDTHSTIALTGATGFIGSRLLAYLNQSGKTVRALYRPKKNKSPPEFDNVTWIAGSLFDQDALNQLVKDTDAVIHCAGAVRGKNQQEFDRVNKTGTHNIAQATIKCCNDPKLLLVSSLAAREPELSYYAKSKWHGEQVIKSLMTGFRWSIIRPPAVFGPGDKELHPLFQSIAKGFIPIPGHKNSRFSMIYVDDLVSAIAALLETDNGHGEIFEIDDGQENGYTWDMIVEIAGSVFNREAAVRKIIIPEQILSTFAWLNVSLAHILRYKPMLTPGKVRELTHPNWVCKDTETFSRLSNWKPLYTLEKGLRNIRL